MICIIEKKHILQYCISMSKKTQEPRLHQKHSTLDPQVKVIAMGPALAGHRRRPNVITVAQNRDNTENYGIE